jgi:MOSC domain-containing protein YiiM
VRGIDVSGAHVGALWRIGSALLEVRQRLRSSKLGLRMDDPPFVRRFADAGRPGAYLGIAEDGDVGACDSVDAVARPDHDVSVGLVAHAVLRDRSRLTDVLAAAPARTWREWIEEQLADR